MNMLFRSFVLIATLLGMIACGGGGGGDDESPVLTATIDSPVNNVTIIEGNSLNFTGSAEYGAAPYSYLWDFGASGVTDSTEEDPGSIVFNTAGIFTITCTVTDNDADNDSTQITVIVNAPDLPVAATINSPVNNVTIDEGDSLNFTGSAANGVGPYSYLWDFDDSGIVDSSLQSPGDITFNSSGTYTITYTVTDNNLDTDSTQISINVSDSGSTQSWQVETIFSTGNVGQQPSIAIDSNDNVHVLFNTMPVSGFGNLNYANNSSGSWSSEIVTGSSLTLSSENSIAIDTNDDIHIAYYHVDGSLDSYDLRYSNNTSGSWSAPVIVDDSQSYVGRYPSIAIDSSGVIHISYYQQGGVGGQRLKYAVQNGGDWVVQVIDGDLEHVAGSFSSMVLDSSDIAHISYYYSYNSGMEHHIGLKYAAGNLSSWSTLLLDEPDDRTVGKYTSIAVDSADKLHISYRDHGNNSLNYATNKGGAWLLETLDSGGVFAYGTSIAVDSNDYIHISYPDSTTSAHLKYATNRSGSWVYTTVDDSPGVAEDNNEAIAVDSNGDVHIVYYDRENQNLKYATTRE